MVGSISEMFGREVIDSRGYPTLEVGIKLQSGISAYASVPSGVSIGICEAVELRDNDIYRYHGRGVTKAIDIIERVVAPRIVGCCFDDLHTLDNLLIHIDNTHNKSNIGANTTLAISIAFAKCMAKSKKKQLFEIFSDESPTRIDSMSSPINFPIPMLNIINGGQHANNNLVLQEFMIVPLMDKDANIKERIRLSCEFFHDLRQNIQSRGMSTSVGDEGGFTPNVMHTVEALDIITDVMSSHERYQKNFKIAIDAAASTFCESNNGIRMYRPEVDGKALSVHEMVHYYKTLINRYPIFAIEDPMSEDDIEGWQYITAELGDKILLVGDDLFVTNTQKLQYGMEHKLGNAILIKPNQIGTITEAIQAIHLARQYQYNVIISHRSGETEDTALSHFAVGMQASYIKAGAPCRSERVAKYNELIRIYDAIHVGRQIFG